MAVRKGIQKFFKRGSKTDSLRKKIGRDAADVTQPADTSPLGQQLKGNDPAELSELQKSGGRRSGMQRAVNKARKEIEALQNKVDELQKENNLITNYNKGWAKSENIKEKFDAIKLNTEIKNDNIEQIQSFKEQIKLLDERINNPKTGLLARNPAIKKSGGKVVDKKQQMAAADWMQGLSQKEIDEILGKPSRDKEGVKRSDKKTPTKTRAAKSGGSIGCGKAMRGHGKGPYKKKGI